MGVKQDYRCGMAGLMLMRFLYGVLHAAGPGHGKAVLSTYPSTHRSWLKCGIVMGTYATLLQGVGALFQAHQDTPQGCFLRGVLE
jgi:ABC-type nickel/cobalt efflux system permease component RcnA